MSNKITKNELHEDIVQVLDNSVAHEADYVKHPGYGVATGSANAYAVTLNPAPTSYVEGMAISVKINTDNTGASTINVNGLGAKAIKKPNGNDVSAGNLKAGSIYTLRYNGTNFILQGEGGEYGTAQARDVRSTKTLGTENGVVQGSLDLSNLIPSNIKNGVTIDGVQGTLVPITAGNATVITNNTEKSTSSTSMVKLKETTINTTGSYRVTFTALNNNTGWNNYAQIYINGVAVGTLRSVTQNYEQSFSEDFSVNAGDKVQVYARTESTSTTVYIRTFYFGINVSYTNNA